MRELSAFQWIVLATITQSFGVVNRRLRSMRRQDRLRINASSTLADTTRWYVLKLAMLFAQV